MYKIWKIKYSESSTPVQVYKIENRRRIIIKHIGTARSAQEPINLVTLANDFIETSTKQLFLFNDAQSDQIINIHQIDFIGVYYSFFHDVISKLIIYIGFDNLKNSLLLDLVVMRMMEPGSKLRSIALLEEYFGIKHRRQKYYGSVPLWPDLKSKAETIAIKFARSQYILATIWSSTM